MADNYLEKKMEEHRRGTAARSVARRLTPVGERRGSVSFKIGELRILVDDASPETGRAIVRRLREAGCKVAFSADDERAGRSLAQSSGARFYPSSFGDSVYGDLVKIWGGVDMLITSGLTQIDSVDVKRVIVVSESSEVAHAADYCINTVCTKHLTSGEIAHLCLLLCLSESACLDGVCLGRLI